MSNRITINKVVETRVEGKPVKNDEFFYGCWCEVLDLIGKELYEAINVKLENTVIFKVRYCKLLEELRFGTKSFNVTWNLRKFTIYTVDYMGDSKKYIKLKCNLIN